MSECCDTKNSMEAQKASLHSIPQSTDAHKHPEVQPIGSKAMQGGNYK